MSINFIFRAILSYIIIGITNKYNTVSTQIPYFQNFQMDLKNISVLKI